jgi:homocysteine S-methyltransferase
MAKYQNNLPQLNGKTVLTDGGLETVMIFQEGVDLPLFASFHLLETAEGRARLDAYFDRYIEIAKASGTGLLLESVTWRASRDWTAQLGISEAETVRINRDAIAYRESVRGRHETPETPMVISGCVGPRGDGYDPGEIMTADEAEAYHGHQIGLLADAGADLISFLTLTNVPEAIGAVRAAKAAGIPIAVSFTVETDGRLPTGDALAEAVRAVDDATGAYPAYFMINCAHPEHFGEALAGIDRIRGLRANASRCSHAELDDAEELDDGNPAELGRQFADLMRSNPQLCVIGGCCGTDHRHIAEIAGSVLGRERAAA